MYHVLFALYTELENPAPQYQLHSLNEWDSQVTAKAFYFTVSQNNRVHLVLISVLRKHVKQKKHCGPTATIMLLRGRRTGWTITQNSFPSSSGR